MNSNNMSTGGPPRTTSTKTLGVRRPRILPPGTVHIAPFHPPAATKLQTSSSSTLVNATTTAPAAPAISLEPSKPASAKTKAKATPKPTARAAPIATNGKGGDAAAANGKGVTENEAVPNSVPSDAAKKKHAPSSATYHVTIKTTPPDAVARSTPPPATTLPDPARVTDIDAKMNGNQIVDVPKTAVEKKDTASAAGSIPEETQSKKEEEDVASEGEEDEVKSNAELNRLRKKKKKRRPAGYEDAMDSLAAVAFAAREEAERARHQVTVTPSMVAASAAKMAFQQQQQMLPPPSHPQPFPPGMISHMPWNGMVQPMVVPAPMSVASPQPGPAPVDANGNVLQCDICRKQFSSKSSLSNHLLTHSDRYMCMMCGRRTASSAHLRSHLAMHERQAQQRGEKEQATMQQTAAGVNPATAEGATVQNQNGQLPPPYVYNPNMNPALYGPMLQGPYGPIPVFPLTPPPMFMSPPPPPPFTTATPLMQIVAAKLANRVNFAALPITDDTKEKKKKKKKKKRKSEPHAASQLPLLGVSVKKDDLLNQPQSQTAIKAEEEPLTPTIVMDTEETATLPNATVPNAKSSAKEPTNRNSDASTPAAPTDAAPVAVAAPKNEPIPAVKNDTAPVVPLPVTKPQSKTPSESKLKKGQPAANKKKRSKSKDEESESDSYQDEEELDEEDDGDDEYVEDTPPSPPPKKNPRVNTKSDTVALNNSPAQKCSIVRSVAPSPATPLDSSSKGRVLRKRPARAPTYQEEVEFDEYSFIEPEWFQNEKSQPFRCEIDPIVPVMLDIHSHLLHTEVIGLLGGEWSATTKVLRILSAHPCRTLNDGTDHRNVELDPISQIEVSEKIAADGQIPVGWYHSHPVFKNDPSAIDVKNQMCYQELFRGVHSSSSSSSSADMPAPFIAAIITPFGKDTFRPLPSSIKFFSTFSKKEKLKYQKNVSGPSSKKTKMDKDGLYSDTAKRTGRKSAYTCDDDQLEIPMELWTSLKKTAPLGGGVESLLPTIEALVAEYCDLPTRVNFLRAWEPDDEAAAVEASEHADVDAMDESASPSPAPATTSVPMEITSSQETPQNLSQPFSPIPSNNNTSNGRTTNVLPSTYIQTKLEQFLHSLSGHLLTWQQADGGSDRKASSLAASASSSAANPLSIALRYPNPKCVDAQTGRLMSPYFQALSKPHQMFVMQVMNMVKHWKTSMGDDEEDSEVEEENESMDDDEDAMDDEEDAKPKKNNKKKVTSSTAQSLQPDSASMQPPKKKQKK